MNVLITAIGSMSAQTVINSLRTNGNNKIVGCDIYPIKWTPESLEVDVFYQVPKTTDDLYLDNIFSICEENEIEFIIPLIDPEVDILSVNRDTFVERGIILGIPNDFCIKNGRNKYDLAQIIDSSDILKTVTSLSSQEVTQLKGQTVIAKPKKGRSSEGIYLIKDIRQIDNAIQDPDDYIFQPLIKGDIYTVDYIRDKYGNDFSLCRKELKRTLNGAGLSAEIIVNKPLSEIVSYIGKKLDVLGCVNIEFIFDGKSFYLIDFNPRFSAGIAFSVLAGYDFPQENLNVFYNKEINTQASIKEGFYLKKYIEIFIEK